jgi:hypothetical protein
MALPTQTAADKEGIVPFQNTDDDGLVYNTLCGVRIYSGTGTPNATVTAPKGSLFIEKGGPDLYMNTDASTTWELVGGQS